MHILITIYNITLTFYCNYFEIDPFYNIDMNTGGAKRHNSMLTCRWKLYSL